MTIKATLQLQRLLKIEQAAQFMVEYARDVGQCAVCNLTLSKCESAECPGHDLLVALEAKVES